MWKDDLQPVLDKMLTADAVFMGSPIYLGNVSGMMYCLMERLVFSLLSYDDYNKRLFHAEAFSIDPNRIAVAGDSAGGLL